MTIGLFVLAVGTFLGGIWANESWGQYWACDPKKTWALISIIIYI
ncbi:cytochrome c biogenesis protein CcsA [uncultured Croceitalea sp.]